MDGSDARAGAGVSGAADGTARFAVARAATVGARAATAGARGGAPGDAERGAAGACPASGGKKGGTRPTTAAT